MVFGHNSNLKLGNITFHVQTEDRGETHALLDTTVYYRGRVLHRRTNNYFDLLPLNEDREQALKLRLEEQHRMVMDEIRSGNLELPIPAEPQPPPAIPPAAPTARLQPPEPPWSQTPTLHLTLVNAKTWLSGKHANLEIVLKDSNGKPMADAELKVELQGAEQANIYYGRTGAQGETKIEFDLPRITGLEPALMIEAEKNGARGQLRFALRVKPRVPSV
jgi:hypothetical protein